VDDSVTHDLAKENPPRELLEQLLVLYPFQPATAFWRWFEMQALFMAQLPVGLGVDLGCGDGRLTKLMLARIPEWYLVGVDPDPAEVALARNQRIYERLYCSAGDKIPEPDGSFDFVFSNSVLEHIPNVTPVLREARRLLKSEGTLVVTVPSAELHACLRGRPLPWRLLFPETRQEYLREFDTRTAHHYYWSDAVWQERLHEAGFARVEIKAYLNEAAVARFESIANHTSGVLFKLFAGKKRPIEIQRTLGLRKDNQALPVWAARAVAAALCAGFVSAPPPTRYGGRLITAFA
jgi:SAM-dependent methyltransferase